MSKFTKGSNPKKGKGYLLNNFYFSPGNLLIILYQLSKFEAPSCNGVCNIKFSMSKFAKGNNSKNLFFFKVSPGNLPIILDQLTKS